MCRSGGKGQGARGKVPFECKAADEPQCFDTHVCNRAAPLWGEKCRGRG